MKQLILSAIFLFSIIAHAQTTQGFGYAKREALPASYIKMLIWNIHAGKDEGFARDYAELASGHHLMLLQEADLTSELRADLLIHDVRYTHARSVISPVSGSDKGVATGRVAKAKIARALRSPVSELGVTTPKVVLLQTFKIENRTKELMVVNVHAINFVTNEMFRAHIEQIIKAIRAHQGPV